MSASIDAVARSRLVAISADASLVEAAKPLSDTQISLVVVCDSDGSMVGVITKTNIVQRIGHCGESACTIAAADAMTRDVIYCRPTDSLPDVFVDDAEARFRAHPTRFTEIESLRFVAQGSRN